MLPPTTLLRNVARRLHGVVGGRIPVEDLEQEGAIGAWLASRKPAPAADQARNSFVKGRSAMIDALRREMNGRAHARADALPDGHELVGPDSTEAAVVLRQQARIVAEEIGRLPELQRLVITQHLEGLQGCDIAQALGVTPSAVSQMQARALASLRRSVLLRAADAQALQAGLPPVDASLATVPLSPGDLFDPEIVRGVSPALLVQTPARLQPTAAYVV